MNSRDFASYEDWQLNHALNTLFASMESAGQVQKLKYMKAPSSGHWSFKVNDEEFVVSCVPVLEKVVNFQQKEKPKNRLRGLV